MPNADLVTPGRIPHSAASRPMDRRQTRNIPLDRKIISISDASTEYFMDQMNACLRHGRPADAEKFRKLCHGLDRYAEVVTRNAEGESP